MDSKSIRELIDLAAESALNKRQPKHNNNSNNKGLLWLGVISMLGAFFIVLGLWNVIESNLAVKASLSLIAIWIPSAIILALMSRKNTEYEKLTN